MEISMVDIPPGNSYTGHPASLQLALSGVSFHDLYDSEKLHLLTDSFFERLRTTDPGLAERFEQYRSAQGCGFSEVAVSSLLVDVAPHLSAFLGWLFGVQKELDRIAEQTAREETMSRFKREFFIRRVLKKITPEQAEHLDEMLLDRRIAAMQKAYPEAPWDDPELATATVVVELLDHERFAKEHLPSPSFAYALDLRKRLLTQEDSSFEISGGTSDTDLRSLLVTVAETFEQWIASNYYLKKQRTHEWVTFKVPRNLDYMHLVDYATTDQPLPHTITARKEHLRQRDGFDLTDPRFSPREVAGEVDYCIFCHERNKDSCSKGMAEKDSYRKNPLGFQLKGCPLDQKISESHKLKSLGDSLGALAVIMIDNPLLPGTGHRICNDCMKACIYQKQDPVNIPQIETRILTEILELPWGFEIYSLLTRWNPLSLRRPRALPYNGMNILIAGLGPAGYTLAHYLLNEGFGVVGIDGLKIEPLPKELVGDVTTPFVPIRDFHTVMRKLSDRVLAGFGGVSEYGITVRWDKNFLTVLQLTLMRSPHFRVYDGVRLGGTLSIEDAWRYGFDHACIATGAGKPTFVSMRNNLIRGIRKASDFLMALQLTGAGKTDSMANLQVQLPAIVIGGGLTAIDTATELMAYYPVQVSKIKRRYDTLVRQFGKESIDTMFDAEESQRLTLFLAHAAEVEEERERAEKAGEKPNFIPLVRKWGGVHVYYRKFMADSPAYRLNHEEIIKGLEEGFSFIEKMSPVEAVPDEHGAVSAMIFEPMEVVDGKWRSTGQTVRVTAHTVMVAAGTVPNVMYEDEHPGTFALDRWREFFAAHALKDNGDRALSPVKKGEVGFFTSYEKNGKYVSFYGDNHPSYAGNVVKAMASAKHGYRAVLALLEPELQRARHLDGTARTARWTSLTHTLDTDLRARVVRVTRLTPTIIEIVVHAPKAAREFAPGQFYRFQNYEVDSPRVEQTLVMMEGIALTGAWVDREKGLIGLITLEVGASSRMCSLLKPGQRVVVMGPTGTPTEIPRGETVILLGGGLGNAVLFSIAKACKEKGSRVLYFAGYKKKEDFFKREEIEIATDVVIYSVDTGDPIPAVRKNDKSFVGNIVQAMLAYARGELGEATIPLSEASRVIAIGSDRMMAAVAAARQTVLKPYLSGAHTGVVSINSSMQCMMKAICAQCLQRHVDPITGTEAFVFSCVNQDQPMDQVDFRNLNARLKVNSVMEKITNRWFDYLLETWNPERV
jgi:NADPH-dependent glutamate synthase beta subunit-like oxidoreductase/NAD(P)H-flavin reductase